ncbi:MAG: envelope stress response membrane protein PspC [Parvularculaceae bacterium]
MRKRRRHQYEDDRRAEGVHPEVERFINHMSDYFDDWRGRGGYSHHVGDPGPGPNRHRVYRNMRDGKVAGVCAGLADYFGWSLKWTRIGSVLLTVFFFPIPVLLYAAAAFLMPAGEPIAARYDNPDEERFWRTYSSKPKMTYADLRHRFRAIDARVADMERAVTSSDYALRKQFRDLERGV